MYFCYYIGILCAVLLIFFFSRYICIVLLMIKTYVYIYVTFSLEFCRFLENFENKLLKTLFSYIGLTFRIWKMKWSFAQG